MNATLEKYFAMMPRNPGFGGMSFESAIIVASFLEYQNKNQSGGDMAEIGVFKGFGASLFAGYLNDNEKIFLIDPFCTPDQFSDAISECAGQDKLNRVVFIKEDSAYLERDVTKFNYYNIRFFHIDGEHSYDAVYSDLLLASRSINAKGIIVVDDIFNNH
jgi:predicted O-methyltransferase YrrM